MTEYFTNLKERKRSVAVGIAIFSSASLIGIV